MNHPARWWTELDDGRIECSLCPRRCRLEDGQRAFCFVRKREGNRLVLTTYGRSTGFCVDPIEKKPLNHFLPGSAVLSFGTAGCNLGCRFCQNWEITKSREIERLSAMASPDAIAAAAKSHGCDSVAYTYNDPIIFAEYAIDTASACHQREVRNVAVTNGFITAEARAEFFAPMDAANVDLKAFEDEFYKKTCLSKPGGLQDILDTLQWLVHESSVWVEITTLLIPGLNDADDDIRAECRWILDELGPDVPVHFTAFHPDFRLRDRAPTPPNTCRRAREIALETGLHFAYTGNIFDPQGQTTLCPGCGTALIERDRYHIVAYRIDAEGRCPDCRSEIAGVFSHRAGDWGSRRLPVVIAECP